MAKWKDLSEYLCSKDFPFERIGMKTDKIAHFQIKVKPIFSYCQMHAEHPLPRNRPNAFLIEAKEGVLGLRKTCHTVTFGMVQEEVKTN